MTSGAVKRWCTIGAVAAALAWHTAALAQEYEVGTPEAGADEFYRSFRTHRWEEMAATLHPEARDLFRERILAVVRGDDSGTVAAEVFGATPEALVAMDTRLLFARLMRGIAGYAPGMLQAMTTKDVRILGHVTEASDDGSLAHVVIRSREPLSGSAPSRVEILSFGLDDGVWRVTWSDELDVVASALVAVPTGEAPFP